MMGCLPMQGSVVWKEVHAYRQVLFWDKRCMWDGHVREESQQSLWQNGATPGSTRF